jgi:hypothetical protein
VDWQQNGIDGAGVATFVILQLSGFCKLAGQRGPSWSGKGTVGDL